MADWLPPYLNKQITKLERDVVKAERKELKAKTNFEYSIEYTKLCKNQLEKAKADSNEKK